MSKFVALLNVFVFMLTAIMSGITKEELVTILGEKLEEKFQRKFDELKQQIDHKLAPLQKMIDEVMETAKFINAKYDDLVEEQKALKLALHTMCSKLFDFHLFADDANLFYENKNISVLETTVNAELNRVYDWLCANMLSLNIQKSNYVIFHPPQRNIRNLNINLMINEVQMKRESCVTYLGVLIDSTLSWKNQVEYVSKK